jgi:hypothetical protein
MSATKRFYEDCAEAGRCPISPRTADYLDDLESIDHSIDWIGYCEQDYVGHDGRTYVADCITMESARRLLAESLANAEIAAFVETFGGFCPA